MDAATMDQPRLDLLMATLLHYDMELPMLLRFLGGNFLGAHRDPAVILPRIRGIVDPQVCADLERILTMGCPNRLNTELSVFPIQDVLGLWQPPVLSEE